MMVHLVITEGGGVVSSDAYATYEGALDRIVQMTEAVIRVNSDRLGRLMRHVNGAELAALRDPASGSDRRYAAAREIYNQLTGYRVMLDSKTLQGAHGETPDGLGRYAMVWRPWEHSTQNGGSYLIMDLETGALDGSYLGVAQASGNPLWREMTRRKERDPQS